MTAAQRRATALGDQLRLVDAGLHNDEGDPELALAGVRFADLIAAARRDVDVFLALRSLSREQIDRLFRG